MATSILVIDRKSFKNIVKMVLCCMMLALFLFSAFFLSQSCSHVTPLARTATVVDPPTVIYSMAQRHQKHVEISAVCSSIWVCFPEPPSTLAAQLPYTTKAECGHRVDNRFDLVYVR